MAEAIPPGIRVRRMTAREGEVFYSICRQNSIRTVRRDYILGTHYVLPNKLLVATSETGEVNGVCFAFKTGEIGIISGFAVDPNVGNSEAIRRALYEVARRRFGKRSIEVTVPVTMTRYMFENQYVWRWNIDTYTVSSDGVKLPSCNGDGYQITETRGTSGSPFTLHFVTPNGDEGEVEFEWRFREPFSSFKLYSENDCRVIGYGLIDRNEEGEWIIGPLYSPEIRGIRIILNKMLYSIQMEPGKTMLVIHVINCSGERMGLLLQSGFKKATLVWSRFSRTHLSDSSYVDWNYVIFALACPVLALC